MNTQATPLVAFVGLGAMGRPMAANLVQIAAARACL